MTATSTAAESQLRKAQAEDSRIAAELDSAERAGADALEVARLRIEKDWSAKRLADTDEDHRIALAAERAAAADELIESVAGTMDREDLAVWDAIEALRSAVADVVDADRHRNAVVSTLSAQLIEVAGASTTGRFSNPSFGGMTVDGRRIASSSGQVGSTVAGIVEELIALSNVALGQQLATAASVQGALRRPVLAMAGGAL